MSDSNLGKLKSTHGISPVFLQRAIIVAVLSFVFFMAMLVGFYIRQNIGYFLLSTAFLIVYILTMLGWIVLRKNSLKVYENGISYKKFTARFDEIAEVVQSGKSYEVRTKSGEKVVLSDAIERIEQIITQIKSHSSKN